MSPLLYIGLIPILQLKPASEPVVTRTSAKSVDIAAECG